MTVKLKEALPVSLTGRMLRAGALGEVLAKRNLTGDCPELLIKFKGVGCPISLYEHQVEIVKQ